MQAKLFVAIPMMDELDNIHSLFNNIKSQSFKNFQVVVCVNQPEWYWEDNAETLRICVNNQNCIKEIESHYPQAVIIDHSTKGKAWTAKAYGVGQARKVLFDYINAVSSDDDIVISLDADTEFDSDYFEKVALCFHQDIQSNALSVPYYHRLTGNENEDRAILHYEIYMRYYAINLWRIKSPYSFTALGSAIAFRIKSYRKIGGISPKLSGEDFYFLQKMQKHKPILNYLNAKVYPAARFSNRVFFGTGPAMIKGASGDWNSYPIYHYSLFNKIEDFYASFAGLYTFNITSEVSDFLLKSDAELWEKLRLNNKSIHNFEKAVHDRFDGLRILQFLKSSQAEINRSDELCLSDFFYQYLPNAEIIDEVVKLDFKNSEILQLNRIRNYLCTLEEKYQLNDFNSRK